jgi:hypothetical protein
MQMKHRFWSHRRGPLQSSEPHEFWAAIGNKMRASFILAVTIGMDVFPETIKAPEIIASSIRVDRRASPHAEELAADAGPARYRIGGRATDASNAPVADASVQIVELGLSARTDGDGRYQIGAMGAGTYTLRVEKGSALANLTIVVPPGSGRNYDVHL